MAAGSKVSDTDQEYQYSYPFTTPSGHEFSFYDTPDNQRIVLKHASGSHIEFKADGSIFLKAVNDIHIQSSVIGAGSDPVKGADKSTVRVDKDLAIDVSGKLNIRCSEFNLEVGGTGKIISGSDLIMTANNVVHKATESISLEGNKSIYMDTKEMRERVVSRRSEAGTMEDGAPGGVNVMNVHGNTIIQNNDANGGITISSKGYLNLVCGQERVDITGMWTDIPSAWARATYSNHIFTPLPGEGGIGILNKSPLPGDYYEYVETSKISTVEVDENLVVGGIRTREVGINEDVTIGINRNTVIGVNENTVVGGIYTLTAVKIFLN